MSTYYTHNPYAAAVVAPEQPHPQQPQQPQEEEQYYGGAAEAPHGTLHATALWDLVTFVPYPTGEFVLPEGAAAELEAAADDELVRVFIGQLPYFVTDMQLAWLCHTFGFGNVVALPERIMKRQPCGERLPTGCVHAYATRRAVDEMAEGMHKRLLIDDTGVWVAQTKEEHAALSAYVAAMKKDKALRVPHRPYDSVVVQVATSTFVAHSLAATPLSAPVKHDPSRYQQRAQHATPPPAYHQQQGQQQQHQQQQAYYGGEGAMHSLGNY